jgi:hypothetical protein
MLTILRRVSYAALADLTADAADPMLKKGVFIL